MIITMIGMTVSGPGLWVMRLPWPLHLVQSVRSPHMISTAQSKGASSAQKERIVSNNFLVRASSSAATTWRSEQWRNDFIRSRLSNNVYSIEQVCMFSTPQYRVHKMLNAMILIWWSSCSNVIQKYWGFKWAVSSLLSTNWIFLEHCWKGR